MHTIEFGLPTGSGGLAAGYHSQSIRRNLRAWAEQYKVNITIESQQHDYRHWLQVTFEHDENLTLFALTWNHKTFMPWQRSCV